MSDVARQGARLIGQRVGNYRVVKLLGEGAMGAVYLGAHETLQRRAAIKVLKPELAVSEVLVQRFVDEARAVSGLGHPCLVEVLDFGTTAGGQLYSVMELLEGRDLARELARRGPLAAAQVAWVGQKACAALEVVHAAGLVHRDLKPANLFLARAGDGVALKVLDFGVAKLLDRSYGGARTQTGHVLGTPEYMAPEQAQGRGDVDGRADLYALGCVLYELAGGRPPFCSDSVPALLLEHVSQPPPPLAELMPRLPAPLVAAIMRCLEKEPGARWQSAAELGAALAPLAQPPPPPELDEDDLAAALAPTSASGEAAALAATSASGEAAALAATSASGEAAALAATSASGEAPAAVAASAPGNLATAPTRLADSDPDRRSRLWLALGAAALVAGAGALALVAGGGESGAPPEARPSVATPVPPPAEPDAAVAEENPYDADDPSALAAGAAIYTSKCARCHGLRGLGDGPDTPRGLEPKPFADAELPPGILDRYRFEVVRRGIDGKMPAFADELSADDVWKLVTFVGTLAEPMPDETVAEIRDQPELTPALARRGARLFSVHCASCHGDRGKGDGRAARYLGRHPADLSSGVFKLRSTPKGALPTDADLFRTISRGMGVSGMPAFSRLPAEDRWALVAHVETLSPGFSERDPSLVIDIPAPPPATEAAAERGRAAYLTAGCPKCHGENGRGDGPLTPELEDYRGHPSAPPDFAAPATFIGGSSPTDIYRTLMTGIGGTRMPAGMDFFDPAEAWDVIAYIRSLAID